MFVKNFGDNPNVCIIGGIHGDEPCGSRSIKTILSKDYNYINGVKYIIANEKALDKGYRYLDVDLNRTFNIDRLDENKHEHRLSKRIQEEIKDCENILCLHSTKSTNVPFSITKNKTNKDLLRKLPLTKSVLTNYNKGDLSSTFENAIEIECGYQKSNQAESNSELFIKCFLQANNCIDTDLDLCKTRLDFYKMKKNVLKKSEKTIFVGQNFSKINKDEVYAIEENGELHRANESFYPVLMSTNGYKDIIGYKGEKVD